MRKPMSRLATIVAAAAVAVSLSACTASAWVPDAPPAAGTQTDLGGLKLRNFMVVSDEDGSAILAGGIASRDDAAQVVSIDVAPQAEDGSFGTAQTIAFSADLPQGGSVIIDPADTVFSDPNLILGRLAQVSVSFAGGKTASLEVPIYASTHPDFAEEWQRATTAA